MGGPDDIEVVSGAEDDGEKYAGGRVLRVMQAEGVIDAVVVVSRWCVALCGPCGGSGCQAGRLSLTGFWVMESARAGTAGRCWALCGSSMSRRVRGRCAARSG